MAPPRCSCYVGFVVVVVVVAVLMMTQHIDAWPADVIHSNQGDKYSLNFETPLILDPFDFGLFNFRTLQFRYTNFIVILLNTVIRIGFLD